MADPWDPHPDFHAVSSRVGATAPEPTAGSGISNDELPVSTAGDLTRPEPLPVWEWDDEPSPEAQATFSTADDEFDLPDYEPVVVFPRVVPDLLLRPQQDPARLARQVVDALDLPRRQDALALEERLADLLRMRRRPSLSADRLLRLIEEEGASAASFSCTLALKVFWEERPELWLERKLTRRGWEVRPSPAGAHGLSWRMAHCVAESAPTYPPSALLDPDWLEDWLQLQPPPALVDRRPFLYFASYAVLRAELEAEAPGSLSPEVCEVARVQHQSRAADALRRARIGHRQADIAPWEFA